MALKEALDVSSSQAKRTEPGTSREGRYPTQLTSKWGHEQPGTGGPMNVTSKTTTHEKLSGLSERAKTAEEHVEAAETKAKTELEQSARRARATAQAQADKLRETARSNEADVSESWKAQQDAWQKHMTKMRDNIEEKRAEHDAGKAERHAENAEGDALFAIDFAYAAIDEAEASVIEAILARMNADELAGTSARRG
jgi:hypothetical protein